MSDMGTDVVLLVQVSVTKSQVVPCVFLNFKASSFFEFDKSNIKVLRFML